MGFNSGFKGLISPAKHLTLRGEYGELLIMPVNRGWDLIQRLKG